MVNCPFTIKKTKQNVNTGLESRFLFKSIHVNANVYFKNFASKQINTVWQHWLDYMLNFIFYSIFIIAEKARIEG